MSYKVLNIVQEPVTLTEAKEHCYVTSDDSNTLLSRLISAAREYAENRTWRGIAQAEYKLVVIADKLIQLPRPPCLSVETVTVDGDEILDYTLDNMSEPAVIEGDFSGEVTVEFTAGYDNQQRLMPNPIKQSILFMVKHFFDNRDTVVISEGRSVDAKEVPLTAEYLLDPYSLREFV